MLPIPGSISRLIFQAFNPGSTPGTIHGYDHALSLIGFAMVLMIMASPTSFPPIVASHQPRSILPKVEASFSSTSQSLGDIADTAHAAKRRCISSACLPCRKRKSKVRSYCTTSTCSYMVGLLILRSAMVDAPHAMLAWQFIQPTAISILTVITVEKAL